ncbi:MAG: hypothetical protein QNJ38_21865 [Prochloraceae cyanobacterium]|nr:hypothetical protein [Prochloraceae cyanobacterium]
MPNNKHETQPRYQGKFDIKGSEPLSKKVVGFRLPQSLQKQLEEMAIERKLTTNELAKQLLIGKLRSQVG